MPRPRKPTKILELKGAFKKDPQRRRDQEPVGCGDLDVTPPEGFDDELGTIWHEVIDAVPAGVLTNSDRILIEMTARLIKQMRSAKPHPTLINSLKQCLNLLGLSPSGRASLMVNKAEKNPFSEFT